MKRKFIASTFMLGFLVMLTASLNAQTDAFFTDAKELRTSESVGAGLGFNFSSFDGQQGGMNFEKFTSSDTPIGNGLLLMTATGLIYLMNKRRKENEK